MFGLFKNTKGAAVVNYANYVGYLCKNLELVNKLNYDEARMQILYLAMYHIKKIQDNQEFENLDVGFKCFIPELSGFKYVTIEWSSTQISSMLFELIMQYDLKEEYQEIIEKRGIFNEIEKFYFNKINK
jgi:hypothetical protein